MKKNKVSAKKQNRELVLNISIFLLGQETLRNLFWNVKTVTYNRTNQVVRIGINTTNGKLGTTLDKLRKTSRYLSDYLYEHGLTFRRAKIQFFVDREEENIERLYHILDKVETFQ